jgi:hypothetical protein
MSGHWLFKGMTRILICLLLGYSHSMPISILFIHTNNTFYIDKLQNVLPCDIGHARNTRSPQKSDEKECRQGSWTLLPNSKSHCFQDTYLGLIRHLRRILDLFWCQNALVRRNCFLRTPYSLLSWPIYISVQPSMKKATPKVVALRLANSTRLFNGLLAFQSGLSTSATYVSGVTCSNCQCMNDAIARGPRD